ncbi:hypothetical protein H3147_07245 [Streptomyces sp. OF8]|uniref:DUF4097 family beta strand repeat protein n=1 Tax=Streptomyces alkaliterrae TaxID=2213162 RepID=A0A5P0YN57_9ACTN|nr:hypothetical protein [Streptomyces alkaliterrae]MQS01784.1 hypothetical protein [Streptomyces alkaliterrae]
MSCRVGRVADRRPAVTDRSEWSISEPQKLNVDRPVERVRIAVVGGRVNVVGGERPHRDALLEVTAVEGPPPRVTWEDGTLTVGYEDLPWQDFLKLPGGRSERRVELSLAVPATARVRVDSVTALAVVSGVAGHTEVRGVTGDTTLVGLGGPVRAETVSGTVQAQSVAGDLRFKSVSGDLTVVDGRGGVVQAETVGGALVVDVADHGGPSEVTLRSVSGEIAVRLAEPVDAVVDAGSAGGPLSCDFEELEVAGQWGTKRVTGTLGAGRGRLRATTVSGPLALLRRPADEDADDTAHPTTLVKDA